MANSKKIPSAVAWDLEQIRSLAEKNQLKKAWDELRELRVDFSMEVASPEAALYHYLKGFTLRRLGEKKEALPSVKKAREMYKTLGDFLGIARSENLLGFLKIDLGNLKEAEEHLQSAAVDFKNAEDWSSAAKSLGKVAYLHSVRGELNLAKYFVNQARECSMKVGDHYFDVVLRGGLAVYELLEGRWKPAVSNLQEFLNETRKARDHFNLVSGLLSLGYANAMRGLFKEARQNYLEAVRICLEEDLTGLLKIAYEYLGELGIAEKRLDEAEDCLKKAQKIGERTSPYGVIMTQIWRLWGDYHNAKGEPEEALKAYGKCDDYLLELPEELERGAAFVGRARAYALLGEREQAREWVEKALDVFDQKCRNDWETAKTLVVAVEIEAYPAGQMGWQLSWAQETLEKLEQPLWLAKVNRFLELAGMSVSPKPFFAIKRDFEREKILAALKETGWNKTKAAEALNMPRTTFTSALKRLKIIA